MRLRSQVLRVPWSMLVAVLAVLALLTGGRLMAQGDSKDKGNESSKSVGAFGESRRGDVPEGTLEMLTPETDKAIQSGLAWLAHSQNADGSFGTGTYRGNIAVTSLAGSGLHVRRLEPRPWPVRCPDRQGARLRDGEHVAVGLHRGGVVLDPRADVLARLRHSLPGRSLRHDPPAGDPREAAEGRPADHRYPEQ